mmetsp:Transcript_56262/g.91530  ORF Transcript_56262/g.91530 Transcript_56262/m.91530 type:complete len:88 (+) Transcript_56262:461-724(+)
MQATLQLDIALSKGYITQWCGRCLLSLLWHWLVAKEGGAENDAIRFLRCSYGNGEVLVCTEGEIFPRRDLQRFLVGDGSNFDKPTKT